MGNLKKNILTIYRKHRSLFVLMVLLFLFGAGIFVYMLAMINPESAVVKVGYGDVGGYRDGAWTNLLTFPILTIIFGTLHNFLAIQLFEKKGSGIAKLFVATSILLLFGGLVVFLRLLGEN